MTVMVIHREGQGALLRIRHLMRSFKIIDRVDNYVTPMIITITIAIAIAIVLEPSKNNSEVKGGVRKTNRERGRGSPIHNLVIFQVQVHLNYLPMKVLNQLQDVCDVFLRP